jgi:hypothetical protein
METEDKPSAWGTGEELIAESDTRKTLVPITQDELAGIIAMHLMAMESGKVTTAEADYHMLRADELNDLRAMLFSHCVADAAADGSSGRPAENAEPTHPESKP